MEVTRTDIIKVLVFGFCLLSASLRAQDVTDTCDYLEGNIIERQHQTRINGLMRGTGYCVKPTIVNGGLELVGANLSIIDGDTVGQVLRWNGTTWVPRLIIFSGGGGGVDTVYNGLTDRDTAFVLGGPLTEHTRVHGQKAYDLTFDDARNLLFEAQRTSGVAYSLVRLGSTAIQGVDMFHYNEADNAIQAGATLNYSTGNVWKIQSSASNVTTMQQYDSGGGVFQTDITASDGSIGKTFRVNKNSIYALYLENTDVTHEAAFVMVDTFTGELRRYPPATIAAQIAAGLVVGRVDAVADSTAFRAYTRTGFDVVIMADSLRGGKFRRCYSCTADQYMIFTDASSRKWERIDFKAVSVKWFGAKGDGSTQDSLAVQKAFNTAYDVWFPAGTYKVRTHTISSPKRVWGTNAILQQASLKSAQAKIITILSDGVTVEGLELRGQISTQTSEFSHGIVVGNESGAGVKNITLSNLKIRNTRGDGIIIVSQTDHCDNVNISNVVMRNIYRNGIAVIAGNNINISAIDADSVGLAGIDLEPDLLAQSTSNVHVSGVAIPSFWVGHHEDTLAQNITLQGFDIDGSRHGCNPAYPVGDALRGVGLATRHTNTFTIQDGTVRNCEGYALYFTTGTRTSRNIRLENVVLEGNNSTGSYANRLKLINQDESNSDSAATFVNCYFDGGGVTDQVGFPAGSIIENCKIVRFDRLMVSARGALTIRKSYIQLNDDLIYDSNGASTFEGCRIKCSYLLRGQSGDNRIYRFINDTITTSVTPLPYTFFGATPANTRFVLKGCLINGAATQSVASGGTIFHDNVTVSGTGAATVILPDLLRRPENIITVNNLTDGRAITFDPDGSTTINGASTAVTLTNTVVTCDNSNWYSRKDGVFGVVGSNGLTASTSAGVATVKYGGSLVENTTVNGVSTYALTFTNFGASNNFAVTNSVALFSTGGGSTGFKILGEINADPTGTYITDDHSFVATTAGGSGIWSNYGRLVFGGRKNNEIYFTINRTDPVLTITSTEAEFFGRGVFSGNLFLKGTTNIKITNVNNFGTVPVYKENFTWQGGMWISNAGDVPLVLEGARTSFPTSVGADLGSFIGTSGGGSSGTIWYDYGRLIMRPRAGKPVYITSGNEPVLTVLNGMVGIGLGMTNPSDTVHTKGTVRHEDLPATATETDFIMANSLGQLAQGPLPDDIVPSASLADVGVTPGTYGTHNKFVEIDVNAKGQITDIVETAFSMATYASSGGPTTTTLQHDDYVVEADPTAGDLTIQLGSQENGRVYHIFGCCNLTNDIILQGSGMKFTGAYGTTSSDYTFGPGEHLEIIYRSSNSTYYISKK